MGNLFRELAPVSGGAWKQIEDEATRTLKEHMAARRLVDVVGPRGYDYGGVPTGHVREIAAPGDGIRSLQRQVASLVELRVPFVLSREELDGVARGSNDPDLQPLKDAARKLAFAEDRAVFDGYAAAGITGIREASDNKKVALPADVAAYPRAIAKALSELRLAGVNGPYRLALGAKAYAAMNGATDEGYPVYRELHGMLNGGIVWAPAIEGGVLLSARGGDYELHLGQDVSIGYDSHDATSVQLYLQETFTFLALTAEASVDLAAG
ncbi:family 1 encapsulin nanocompartment shell protein [Luteibacter aegosomatissinici]|uniref:family 1 encapsulin nanocompartment shell protein n=1 Tax=Luteibacter aegosomatissinici TaxID=2911539 RepID=UPI001FF91FF5|nr:family 1 encapsulin nanocompartment shell protein [Luteibacter aegosomatissinici]UPG92567.1 bacteriocin family protein [Luteibacter aegosomatissinici]